MFTLTNGNTLNNDNPASPTVPSSEEKAPLRPGNLAKVRFESRHLAETMWVRITKRDGPDLQGTLENEPFLLDDVLSIGETITFTLDHILDIEN